MVFSFQGNYIDLIIFVLLFIWIVDGWERGFFVLLANLVSFLGSFVFALRFYSRTAFVFIEYFSLSRGFANALGFFLVYLIAHSIITVILVGVLRELPQRYSPRLWQKFLGIFPAALNGLIVVAVLLTLGVSMPIRGDVKESIFESQIGGLLIRRTSALERRMDVVFGEAIQESLAFLTVEPKGAERVALGFELQKPEFVVSERLEVGMFALLNHERDSRGISELEWDPSIVPVARGHAKDMFERGYFSHISLEGQDVGDRLQEAGVAYLVAGENLALAPSLDMAHEGLIQSPGHRANILAPEFGRVGIGVIDGGNYGKMFVQVFAD
ncbi:CvpA family protein [Patescibacteria group bacterium]|nr:CvpA family protein [Patescibacteria group bacterium]